ncbi:MAG: hypothetical protein QXL94_01805 [Candidatus Parvarchaeum sp.]
MPINIPGNNRTNTARKSPDPCLKCVTKKIKIKEDVNGNATICVNRGTRKNPIKRCVTVDRENLPAVRNVLAIFGNEIER